MNVANRLKAADDVWAEANKIVAEIVAKHGKVVYNGNNYDAAWKQIAAKRGLPNLDDIGALMKITDDKNIGVFERRGSHRPSRRGSTNICCGNAD